MAGLQTPLASPQTPSAGILILWTGPLFHLAGPKKPPLDLILQDRFEGMTPCYYRTSSPTGAAAQKQQKQQQQQQQQQQHP